MKGQKTLNNIFLNRFFFGDYYKKLTSSKKNSGDDGEIFQLII